MNNPENKITVVLGATPNPERYGYKAVQRLAARHHTVIPVGIKQGVIEGMTIQHGTPAVDNVHTVTLYLNPETQKKYYDYILGLTPKRIIFNPGTENPELESLAAQQGIETLEACTLTLLSIGAY